MTINFPYYQIITKIEHKTGFKKEVIGGLIERNPHGYHLTFLTSSLRGHLIDVVSANTHIGETFATKTLGVTCNPDNIEFYPETEYKAQNFLYLVDSSKTYNILLESSNTIHFYLPAKK